jgi:hypothetical protein
MRLRTTAVLLAFLAMPAAAADKPKFGELPPPPEPVKNYKSPTAPPAVPTGDEAIPEPEVIITEKGQERHEEYRISGRLYMIKVIPKRGAPYYLIDNEGRGDFVRSDFPPSVSPPMWVIKRF